MATGSFFREVELPEQKSYGHGVLFPVVLSPNTNKDLKLCAFEDAIKAHKPRLESLLKERGVILFRGFPVTTPSDFKNVVEAFGFPEALYIGGRAPRTKVVGRVYTANESPPDKRIPFHHEMATAAEQGTKLEWMENAVRITTGPLPAIRLDKESQRKTWLNNLAVDKTAPMKGDDRGTFVELGNGDLVPDHVLQDCLKIQDEECVTIPWKKGDVMLLNNLTVLHAREPLLKPPRRVLASLCK